MTENELIQKIQALKEIKPREDWVSLTKSRILEEGSVVGERFSINWRWVLGTVIVFGVLCGIFVFSQNSLPGDFLYPIKKITEKSQVIFIPPDEEPIFQLKLANERLEDLTRAPARNLAPTINEFQASLTQATENLVKIIESTTSQPIIIKKIVEETKKLKENKKKVEALGIVVESGEVEKLDSTIAKLVEREIKDLEDRSLTQKQQALLKEAKKAFERGDYSQALIKILYLTQ